ncbi:uncharacterized protein LOC132162383 [Corylus avellana]|uniref:uncharacterized protein LOC132162383 n=1 Tax=Corylus avellana TaxID=13451 RepID=UPI00286CF20C|nr:uncharacterized protein LOC132162383 [Corylus avellana]
MRFPMPGNFKVPWVGEYDRSGDPSDHKESFRAHIILHETPDEIACQAFPLTLKGVAKEWFGSLSPKSVDSFDYLGQQFLGQFLATGRRKKNPTYLLSLMQGKDESLKEYLSRFNREKLTVESTDEQTILSALMHGIQTEGPLMAELSKRPKTGTLRQFNSKAEEFINQEETISALLKSKAAESKFAADPVMTKPRVIIEKKKKDSQNPKVQDKKVGLLPHPNHHQQYVGWTPLNTTVYRVFMEVKKDPSFRWPGRMKSPPQHRSTQKFCEYHNDHGHQTEDCISLRFEIEKFLRNGKLLNFLAEENSKGKNIQDAQGQHSGQNNDRSRNQRQRRDEPRISQNQQQNPQNQAIIGEIRTISGGLASGGESSSARKAYAKQARMEEIFALEKPSKIQKREPSVLTFSEEDAKEVSMPHDDALVIILTVANHAVHQVLIDNGSSADIIYWTVVQQLGIGREKLKPFLSSLIGFAGEHVQPIGLISLPVTAGTAPRQSTIMVDFLVIDQPSAYNMIIGRPALNQLRAVTSTYHLKMKFPTIEGVGEVRGDQVVARRCYNTSLKKCPKSALLMIGSLADE